MQAKRLPARAGWRWLGSGLTIFLKNPPMLTMVIFGYWLTLAVINIVPLLGPVVATLAIPAFSVSLMNAVRKLDSGQPLDLAILFSGFRKALQTLLTLGGLYLGAMLIALGASAIADGGMFLQTILGNHKPTPEEIASREFLAGAQIALLLMMPVAMAWWFAPMLAAWHGFSAGKALFFSLAACLRNWRAFLAYAACTLLFGALLPSLFLGALVSLMPEASEIAPTLITLPLLFILAPALVASFYVSYREVFAEDAETPLGDAAATKDDEAADE